MAGSGLGAGLSSEPRFAEPLPSSSTFPAVRARSVSVAKRLIWRAWMPSSGGRVARYVAAESAEEARRAFAAHGLEVPADWRGYMDTVTTLPRKKWR